MDLPEFNLNIRCEEKMLFFEDWIPCQSKAVAMLVFHHIGTECVSVTMALCQRHVDRAQILLDDLNRQISERDNPECKWCHNQLTKDGLGKITLLTEGQN